MTNKIDNEKYVIDDSERPVEALNNIDTNISRSRDWFFTVFIDKHSVDDVVKVLDKYDSYVIGAIEETLIHGIKHIHGVVYHRNPIRFTSLKKALPTIHLEKPRDRFDTYRYSIKEGKLKEKGNMPLVKKKDKLNYKRLHELIFDYEMSKDEILLKYPIGVRMSKDIDKLISLRNKEKTKKIRDVKVTYIFGPTGAGKTYYCYENYSESLYKADSIKHPFDNYNYQETLLLDEFNSKNMDIELMLKILDGYPLELTCRYENKYALWSNVLIVSNLSLSDQYRKADREHIRAFHRRIDTVLQFQADHSFIDISDEAKII